MLSLKRKFLTKLYSPLLVLAHREHLDNDILSCFHCQDPYLWVTVPLIRYSCRLTHTCGTVPLMRYSCRLTHTCRIVPLMRYSCRLTHTCGTVPLMGYSCRLTCGTVPLMGYSCRLTQERTSRRWSGTEHTASSRFQVTGAHLFKGTVL